VLDNFALGVIVVSDGNQILFANRTALTMFARGHPVRSLNGRLSTRDSEAIDRLYEAIALVRHGQSATGAGGFGVALKGALGERALAYVFPLACGDPAARLAPPTAAVLVMSAVVRPTGNVAAVARCFGLTPAESRITERLVAGATLVDAAADLGIADTTAKTHLSHIFSKTGVGRQADLIALIHRVVPPVLVASAHR
jgi:DNA-binding CsgD family transcriptional regulator